MHGPKPCELIGESIVHGPKLYEFNRKLAIHGPKPYALWPRTLFATCSENPEMHDFPENAVNYDFPSEFIGFEPWMASFYDKFSL